MNILQQLWPDPKPPARGRRSAAATAAEPVLSTSAGADPWLALACASPPGVESQSREDPVWACGWYDSSHDLQQGLEVREAPLGPEGLGAADCGEAAGLGEPALELWLHWYAVSVSTSVSTLDSTTASAVTVPSER